MEMPAAQAVKALHHRSTAQGSDPAISSISYTHQPMRTWTSEKKKLKPVITSIRWLVAYGQAQESSWQEAGSSTGRGGCERKL